MPTLTRPTWKAPARLPELHAAVARVDITPPLGTPIGGFSIIAIDAEGWHGRLWSNVLLLGRGVERIALVQVDLHAGTRYLNEKIAGLLDVRLGLSSDRVVLLGSHTHAGPGGLYGYGMYDKRASSDDGFFEEVADELAGRIAGAITEAAARLRPARVGFGRKVKWRSSQNKSLDAFAANGLGTSGLARRFGIEELAPFLADRSFRAVDPRVSVLWAETTDRVPLGALAFFGGHCATVSPFRGLLSGDGYGATARHASQRLFEDGRFWPTTTDPTRIPVGIVAGASADANLVYGRTLHTEMPLQAEKDDALTLPRRVGEELGEVVHQACLAARDALLPADAALSVIRRVAEPRVDASLAEHPQTGRVAAGASEYGRYFLKKLDKDGASARYARTAAFDAPEGTLAPHPSSGHGRKVLIMDDVPEAVRGLFRGEVQHEVDLRCVRIGPLTLVAVPFEVSVCLASEIEQAVRRADGDTDRHFLLATISGGYASYATTEPEYDAQHYEGSSVLWGGKTGRWLVDRVRELAAMTSQPPVGATVEFPTKSRKLPKPSPSANPKLDDLSATRADGVLRAHWKAPKKSVPHPADGPVVRLERKVDGAWEPARFAGAVVDDRDGDVAVFRDPTSPREWSVVWAVPEGFDASGELRWLVTSRAFGAKDVAIPLP